MSANRSLFLLPFLLAILLSSCSSDPPPTTPFVSELRAKANGYQAFLDRWHRPGLGALLAIEFTDEKRQQMKCGHYQGDSTIWTGMYLGSQALRYLVTRDPAARAEVIDTVRYLHQLMEITETPGYIGRFAGPNTEEFSCDCPDGNEWKVHAKGAYEGYYWIDHTSRDQYSGWLWGLAWAYDAVDDPEMRAIIRTDIAAVLQMLEDNQWHITDQNGEWTGNNAHFVGFVMRLSWILIAAHVTDDPHYWDLLEQQFKAMSDVVLWGDTLSAINRYSEYFGNNLRHLTYQSIFRLWPDREGLERLWKIWLSANRPWVEGTLNPWFDSVHVTGCLRVGECDPEELASIRSDYDRILQQYWEPPSYRREVVCSQQPLDPFSVQADAFLNENPWLREIIDIRPQTAEARELTDRHWTDIYWQSGGVFEATCHTTEDQTFVGPGMDYLLAYYIGVYYGILPE